MSADDIACLAAIFPSHPQEQLCQFLAASNNNLERATNALLRGEGALVSASMSSAKRRKLDTPKLDNYFRGSSPAKSKDYPASSLSGAAPIPSQSNRPPPAKSAFTVLKAPTQSTATSNPTAIALPPLTLASPPQVFETTHGLAQLIPNALPKELAARLYLKMIDESLGVGREDGKAWEKNRWYMFDRQVESPHTTSFYVEPPDSTASAYDQQAFAEAARYWYNGEQRDARTFMSEMDEAREVIRPLIKQVLATRNRHSMEYSDWTPNVAAANCYRGAKEGVGWHSDVLTYLGPYPTIASLSLGVTRPFRLRAAAPSISASGVSTAPRTLSIPLPHNSLLIMHAGCQEKYKHCVPEVNGMDVFRLPQGLDLGPTYSQETLTRAYRERINITYRHYRPDFAPLPASPSKLAPPKGYVGTPMCKCGIPCHLRPDARGKAAARLGRERPGPNGEESFLYFWTCNNGAQNQGKTCGMWQLLDMEKEGRGKWFQAQG